MRQKSIDSASTRMDLGFCWRGRWTSARPIGMPPVSVGFLLRSSLSGSAGGSPTSSSRTACEAGARAKRERVGKRKGGKGEETRGES